MGKAFDPYHKWLGIPPKDQPPHLYRLLGIAPFEADLDVIDSAANRVMSYLKDMASGEHSDDSQKLLNEVAAARITLLNKEKRKAYDAQLRAELPAEPDPHAHRPPVAKPAVQKQKKKGSTQEPPAAPPAISGSAAAVDPELQQALASISNTKLKPPHEEHPQPEEGSGTQQMLVFGGIGAGVLGLLLLVCVFAFSGGDTDASNNGGPDVAPGPTAAVEQNDAPPKEPSDQPPDEPEDTRGTVDEGEAGEVAFMLESAIREETKILVQDVKGNRIDLTGAEAGKSPSHIAYRIPVGKYTVELNRSGYEPFRAEFEVQRDQQSRVYATWLVKVSDDGRGLAATYYSDPDFLNPAVTRADLQVNFFWHQGPPAVGVPADGFSVRWQGFLKAPRPGNYQLTAIGDDWIRVIVDDNVICEVTEGHDVGGVRLSDQPHRLEVAMHDKLADAHAILCWELEGEFVRQVVPAEALFCNRDVAMTSPAPADVMRRVPASTTAPDGGGAVDLLPWIVPERDAVAGPWWFDQDILVCGPSKDLGSRHARLTVPYRFPAGDFAVEAEVERFGRDNLFAIGLPLVTAMPAVLLDDPAVGRGCRLEGFGSAPAPPEARCDTAVLPLGTRVPLRCIVNHGGVGVDAGDVRLIDWHGDLTKLLPCAAYEGMAPRQLALGSDNGVFRIHRLTWEPGGGASRYPLPSVAELAAAEQHLGQTYPVASDATVADKQTTAKLLLELAEDQNKPLAERCAAYRLMLQLAFEAKDRDGAERGTRGLMQTFGPEALPLAIDSLLEFGGSHAGEEAAGRFAEAADGMFVFLLDQDRIDLAAELSDAVHERVRTVQGGGNARKTWFDRRNEMEQALTVWQAYQQAVEDLLTNPDDPAAHAIVGQRLCFVRGQWSEGLPHLAAATPGPLRDLAAKELAAPATASQWLPIADGWGAQAESNGRPPQQALTVFAHALAAYDKARATGPSAAELAAIDAAASDVQTKMDALNEQLVRNTHDGDFALAFDGRKDYVKTPLLYDGFAMTLEAIVKPSVAATGAPQTVIGNYENGGFALDWQPDQHRWQWTIQAEKDNVRVQIPSDAKFEPDEWIHVAAVYLNGLTALYVNGVPQGRALPVGKHKGNQCFVMIGAQPNPNGLPEMFFQGEIREVRITTGAVYPNQFVPPKDLRPTKFSVLAYQLNEGQGQRATNTSGFPKMLHGEIVGATWVPVE